MVKKDGEGKVHHSELGTTFHEGLSGTMGSSRECPYKGLSEECATKVRTKNFLDSIGSSMVLTRPFVRDTTLNRPGDWCPTLRPR